MNVLCAQKFFVWKMHSPAMGCLADGDAGGDVFLDDGIQFRILGLFSAKPGTCHAASDVNAHQCRKNPVLESHGKSDRAVFSRMNIRHDADLASG